MLKIRPSLGKERSVLHRGNSRTHHQNGISGMIQHNETRTQHFIVFWNDTDQEYDKSFRECFSCIKPELFDDFGKYPLVLKTNAKFLLTGHMAKIYTERLTINELLTLPKKQLRRRRTTQPTWPRTTWWRIEGKGRKPTKAGCNFWATHDN